MNTPVSFTNDGKQYQPILKTASIATNSEQPLASGPTPTRHVLYQGVIRVGSVVHGNAAARGCFLTLVARPNTRAYAGTKSEETFKAANEVSAFTELDALRADDSAIRATITGLRLASPIQYKDRLATRIEQLLEAYKDDAEGHVFSSDSLRGLIAFLEESPLLRYPTVTVTRTGDLYASWKQNRDHVFSAQFLRSKQVRFVIIRPNLQNVGQSEQLSGLTTPQALPEMISRLDVGTWASE